MLLVLLLLSTLIDDAASSITVLMHVNLRTTAEQVVRKGQLLGLLWELKLRHIERS